MNSHWTIWVDANKKSGSEKLLNRVLKRIDVEAKDIQIKPYHKGGHTISFQITHNDGSWNDIVIECIALGQRTAHGWGIYGDIFEDPSGSSNNTNVAGVDMIEWKLFKR